MFLPDQNQLYALYMFRCGELRVGKPSREVLALLTEDDRSWQSRLSAEAAARGVTVADLAEIESDTPNQHETRAGIVPLALRRTLRLEPMGKHTERVHIGARGAMALLSLIPELPWLERIDLSNLTSLFLADAYQVRGDDRDTYTSGISHPHTNNNNNNNSNSNGGDGGGVIGANADGITGNDVVAELCRVSATHLSLRAIDLRGQPIGCLAAHDLLELLRRNRRIRELRLDRQGVDYRLAAAMDAELQRNAQIPREAPRFPREPSAAIRRVSVVDRKTLREQQLLRRLLESEPGWREHMPTHALADAVLHARVMSTTEVATRAKGLRGDGRHVFVVKSGALRVRVDPRGFELRRGDFFGEAYDGRLFPPGELTEAQRGVVYGIPLEYCAPLLEAWSRQVSTYVDKLRRVALLQPLDAWTRLRLCCCASTQTFHKGDVVISAGDGFKGIFFVTCGGFGVMGRSVHAPRTKEFGVGDVFGEEALVARRQCSSVSILADMEGGSCVVVTGCGARVLRSYLQPVLLAIAADYSLHEELQPIKR